MSDAPNGGEPKLAGATADRVLRIGTRGSELATTQAGHVRDALIAAGFPAELTIIRTEGDVNMAPVERIGVGVFTHALRDALAGDRCDVAVHSYKDLPTAPDERFAPIATPEREYPFDVLVSAGDTAFAELGEGARVGTSAPRRRAQLAALRPDIDLVPLRGNIETRMGFVTSGELDAVVLAGAGLARTGRLDKASQKFTSEHMIPAPAQGALAVEARADDAYAVAAVAALDHAESTLAVTAERRVLAVLEAGCTAPVGAIAQLEGGELHLEAVVASVAGTKVLRESASAVIGDDAAADAALGTARELGETVANALLAGGAAEVVAVANGDADERAPLAPQIPPEPGGEPGEQHGGDAPKEPG